MRLRGGKLNLEQSSAIAQLEETLEDLEHAMGDRHLEEGREIAKRLSNEYTAFRKTMPPN